MEGGQPRTGEQALGAHQGSPCRSSNSSSTLLCLVWREVLEDRASRLLCLSTSSHCPARQFPFPSRWAWGMALLLLRDQLSLSVPSTLYLATGKVLVNKASVPSRGCSSGWVRSRRDAQSRAVLHQATGESTTHLQHPSLETNQTLSFAAACFSVNPIPASLAPFLRHLVQSPPAAVMNSAGEQCLASSVSLCS